MYRPTTKTGIAASATNVIQSWLAEKPPWIASMTSESRYSVEKTSADSPTILILVVRFERAGSSGTPTPEAGEAAGWIVAVLCMAEDPSRAPITDRDAPSREACSVLGWNLSERTPARLAAGGDLRPDALRWRWSGPLDDCTACGRLPGSCYHRQ